MNRYRPIRYGRIVVQAVAVALITIAIATGVPCLLSKMQIIPAIAACATVWLIVWLVTTVIFGRIYCSTVCPTGALIDLFSFVLRSRKSHFSYCPPSGRLRLSVLVIAVLCTLFGVTAIIALLDPYSAFARIVAASLRPLSIGLTGLFTAAATLALIIIVSRRRGRLLCNTICPVGTVLGNISRISFYHADINTDLCVNCGRCADVCSSQCINLTDHIVDLSRCVVCFDCMDVCPNSAITYRRGRHQLSIPLMQRVIGRAGVSAAGPRPEASNIKPLDRRTFIMTGVVTAAAAPQAAVPPDRPGVVAGAVPLVPLNHVTPPGISSREDFLRRCTACGACVAACPTGVLTMSAKQYGIRHSLIPVMDFERAYCDISCVRCTEVCPTKALKPLTPAEKRVTPVGRARISASNCRLYVNGTPCGVCVRSCPKRAISIVTGADGRRSPQVVPELCIGCGQCSYACPSQPYSAIVIEGL